MTGVTASAPGKVVLSGEYAVLGGAPAVSMAVNRRATATVHTIDGDDHVLDVAGTAVPGDFALFDAVVGQVCPRGDARFHARLDTTAFAEGGRKLGIGSSAAIAVALAAALDPDGRATLENAFAAHARLQGGVGSGIDVATSATGGLIGFRRGAPVSVIDWPARLSYALLWSGVPASTSARVRAADMSAGTVVRRTLDERAAAAAEAWASGDAGRVLAATAAYADALRAFSDEQDLDVFAAGHDAMSRAADRQGLVYKPCGAGGGDVGIVLGRDDDSVASFAESAEARGFSKLDIVLDPDGVRVTRQES